MFQFPAAAQDKGKPKDAPAAAKWEYKVATLEREDEEATKALNKLADEGWELVTAVSDVSGNGARMGSGPITTKVRVVLKRPKN